MISGRGAMGRLFARLFNGKDIAVQSLDRPFELKETRPLLAQSELIFLCIPAQAFEEVLSLLAPMFAPQAIVMDICSVKVQPLKSMLTHHSGPVVGTHPLFGPHPGLQSELRTVLVQGRGEQALQTVKDLMQDLGLQICLATAEEHDRALAVIQGLNFVTTLSYLACGAQEPGIEKFLTPSFERRLKAAQKMITQDAQLFQSLFEANPFSHEAVRIFRSHLNLAAAGELDLLQEKASWWWRASNDRGGP